jgi:hypothetical protein
MLTDVEPLFGLLKRSVSLLGHAWRRLGGDRIVKGILGADA